jgi:hypothetical protein
MAVMINTLWHQCSSGSPSSLFYRYHAICIISLRWRLTPFTRITSIQALHHHKATVYIVITQVSLSPVRHELSYYILTSRARHVLTIR